MKNLLAHMPLLGMSFCLGAIAWALTGLFGFIVAELWFFALSIVIHEQNGPQEKAQQKPEPFPSLLAGHGFFQRKRLRQG